MKLRLIHLSLLGIALTSSLTATPKEQETIIQNLLTSRTAASFADAYLEAQQFGITSQALLEARFLYLVDQQDYSSLAALATELVAATKDFDPKHSNIFSLKEDWLAIVHYTQALDALEKKQPDLFKKHITEAFWLSPRQASAFAPHIDQFRLDLAMLQLTLPLDLALPTLHKKSELTPIFDKQTQATLLYFWSPWSREFHEEIADFKALSALAKSNQIHCIAVLVEKSSEVEIDAKKLIAEEQLLKTANWCTDTDDLHLSRELRIQTAPIAVLISREGKILSNSHPSSDQLWSALKRINPQLTKPAPQTTP